MYLKTWSQERDLSILEKERTICLGHYSVRQERDKVRNIGASRLC